MSFFFQAEDGIRGLYVTGVQTCALPILRPGHGLTSTSERSIVYSVLSPSNSRSSSAASFAMTFMRSEERRVGKAKTTHRKTFPYTKTRFISLHAIDTHYTNYIIRNF